MRSLLSSRCARVALCAITAILCLHNVAPAGPPEWIGGLFKSKKAAEKQPPLVNVPNFSADPNATISQANASVTAAAQAATQELNQVVARQGVRPSQMAVPMSIRNQTNDQYLAGLLQKAQATPKAQGQFANKFPELRSDFRRTKIEQPNPNATNAGSIAAWLGNGTAAPSANTASNKPNSPNPENVQVAHTDEVNGQSLADWANVPVDNTPAAAAVADALTGAETNSADPVVPEQYRNMKIPGLPEDARIMSVQDRVVSPAVIPGSNQTAETSVSSPAAPSGVPVEIENMVPRIIDNTVPQPTMSFTASQPGMNQMPPPSAILAPPATAVGQTMTSQPTPTVAMQPSMTMQPSMAMQPPVSMPHQTVFPPSLPSPSMPMNAQAASRPAGPQATFPVTQQSTAISPQSQVSQAPQNTNIPTGMPVQLTIEQIKNLPPGTKLIPANDAAVAALRNHAAGSQPSAVAASKNATAPPTAWAGPQPVGRPAPTAAPNPKPIQPTKIASGARMRTTTIQPGAIVRSSETTPATSIATAAPSAEVPATVAAAAASQVAATETAPPTPVVPSGPTQSMLVKDRLNRAFEISRTDPITAESEFLAILRYVAEAHDDAEGLDSYAPAFERGLLTLREAEQMQETLMNRGEQAAIELAHTQQSEVSQSYSNGKIATADVVDAYYLYARHSMMIAIGEQPLGSQALYGWGQLCSTRSQRSGYNNGIEQGKASLILAAALDADETNWRAHNEMGIIFARQGDYAESEKSFRRSLAVNPTDEAYNNIAKVVDRQSTPDISSPSMPTLNSAPAGPSTYVQTDNVPKAKPAATTAQVGAQQPLGEESSRRSKVKAFVDRLMGNDEPVTSYQNDDGIPISAK